MTLKDQIDLDEPIFYDSEEFAEEAVYNGTPILVVEAETGERVTGEPGFVAPLFTVLVKSSDVTRPKGGDTVVFRGVTCTVGDYPTAEGNDWRVELERLTVGF